MKATLLALFVLVVLMTSFVSSEPERNSPSPWTSWDSPSSWTSWDSPSSWTSWDSWNEEPPFYEFGDSPLYAVSGFDGVDSLELFKINPNNGQLSPPLVQLPSAGDGQAIAYHTPSDTIYRFEQGSLSIIELEHYTFQTYSLPTSHTWRAATYFEQEDLFILTNSGDIYIFDPKDHSLQYGIYVSVDGVIHGISFTLDGEYILACTDYGYIYKYTAQNLYFVERYNVPDCFGLTRAASDDQYFMIGRNNGDRYLLTFNIHTLGQQPAQYLGGSFEDIYMNGLVYADNNIYSDDFSCCKSHPTASCSDSGIANCVCAHNITCCSESWSQDCVDSVAQYGCGDCSSGPCCTDHYGKGCQNRQTTTCVCQLDNSCCLDRWSQDCVDLVNDAGCGECVAPISDCCQEHDNKAGCNDHDVESCVCRFDPFCCSVNWDASCINSINIFECGQCDAIIVEDDYINDNPAGNCCEAHSTGGCSVDIIEDCVCSQDVFCCSSSWDEFCVSETQDFGCYQCNEEELDDDSNCCYSHDSSGCDNSEIQECVCQLDSFCCSSNWDVLCADHVNDYGCGICENKRELKRESFVKKNDKKYMENRRAATENKK